MEGLNEGNEGLRINEFAARKATQREQGAAYNAVFFCSYESYEALCARNEAAVKQMLARAPESGKELRRELDKIKKAR